MSKNSYTLTDGLKKRFKTQYKISEMVCSGCGKTIAVGEEVVRVQKKHYHISCWQAKFLDVED